jgi:AcrR family transcriptional regulator
MDVREKILAEATRLFANKGVDGTALQEVADAVGLKKPSLLYHFPSKEALHASVLEHLLTRWNDALPRLLKAAARDNRFDAILDETIEFFAADPDRARLLLRETLDRPAQMRELLRAHASSWLGLVAESIRKAQHEGGMMISVDPEAYVLQVIHLVVGTFAVGPILQVLVHARGQHDVDARLIKELKRMARVALLERSKAKHVEA